MRKMLESAPGAVWAALIVGLVLLADWLAQYFGGLAWVPPVAGLLTAVIVPILRVFAQGEAPVGGRATAQLAPRERGWLARWLWG